MSDSIVTKHIEEIKDQLSKSFPLSLVRDLCAVLDILPLESTELEMSSFFNVQHNGESLEIPYRLYYNEPSLQAEQTLTTTQRTILDCIYTRHHNGYIRQRRLESLADKNLYWTTPFIIQLLGEYILEIIDVLDKKSRDPDLDNFKKFAIENPSYWQLIECEVISYWNEYYRSRFPKFQDYVGKVVLDRINSKVIGKPQDEIREIGIDDQKRLTIKPQKARFPLVYRTATEVHWDDKGLFLYSPKPQQWSYLEWFNHILNVAENECNCRLFLTERTLWSNIPKELKRLFRASMKGRI
jgi:hypothetical protein